MGFLRTIGKIFAGFFILLGITLFIISSLGSYAVKNINVLERDVSSDEALDVLFKDSGINLQELKQDCAQNPNNENCQIFSKNPILGAIEKQINDFRYYGSMARSISIILFIMGLLLFVWCSGWIIGLRDVSLISFIGMLFSYLYFIIVIPAMLNKLLPEQILNIINNWVTVTTNQTLNLILILSAIFLILTVGLYILKYKMKPSKEASKKEQNGP